MNLEPLLTAPEVAGLFRVSVQTVRVWRLRGRLPGVRLGKGIRFRRRDVENALRTSESASPAEPDHLCIVHF